MPVVKASTIGITSKNIPTGIKIRRGFNVLLATTNATQPLSSQLNMHMKSCIEGITYDCNECDQTFMQRQYLKNHFEKQHVMDENCNVYCLKCIKLYKYRNSFVKHMKKEHNIKV